MNRSSILAALAVASLPFLGHATIAATGRAPYQEAVNSDSCFFETSNVCVFDFKPVPANRRLEVKHMACLIFASSSFGISQVDVAVVGPNGEKVLDPADYLIPIRPPSTQTDTYVVNAQTFFAAREQQKVRVTATALSGDMNTLRCVIAGDLYILQ